MKSGKLCCSVGVGFKPLLKIWICEGVKLTLGKFRTLGWIISSFFGWFSLLLGHKEKNYLLRNCSHFLPFGSEHLAYLVQLLHVHLVGHYYWSRFCHSFQSSPFQAFLPVFLYMVLFYQKMVSFPLSKLQLVWAILFCYFYWACLLKIYFPYVGCYVYLENGYHCFLLSLLIVQVSTFPIIFGGSAILRFLSLSQTLCSIAETWRSVVQVPFLLSMKYFYWFFFFFLGVSLP